MYMDALTLAISYKGTLMGYVASSNLIMARGLTRPQSTLKGLAITSKMMSRYVGNVVTDTIATGFEVKLDGVNSIEWLSTAVNAVQVDCSSSVPLPLQLIKDKNLL
ncbi:hypothetical protein KI688_002875 [Linnemannia hyalina]|uniref:Uncharacterized protein n=1 Tax=Linnemannia hyalina TaxID=64524 RepID=A0A9P8BT55_9FUNG|nr:hypothetical protein KI688_002875 [Linnemannia hyalina]